MEYIFHSSTGLCLLYIFWLKSIKPCIQQSKDIVLNMSTTKHNKDSIKLSYRKILQNILRIVTYTIAGLAAAWIGFFVYLSKPYIIEIDEVRTTGKLETVRAYWGRACGEDFLSEGRPGTKLILTVPEGGITPRETNAVVPGNLFIITGYRYKRVQKNLLNGEVKEIPSQRFDVVKWHVVPPYEAYVDDKDVLIKKVNTPLGWKSHELEPNFTFYNRSESVGC